MYQQSYNYYPQPQNYQMIPQQPMYQTPYLKQVPTQVGLKGRLVSSLEEARATSIDFDGSIFYFPDLANRCIYTKQINMDGTATLNIYEIREIPTQKETVGPSIEQFVTRDELEQALTQLRQSLTQPMKESEPQPMQRELLLPKEDPKCIKQIQMF